MVKGKYKEWLDSEHLTLLKGWKMQGLTDEQVAKNIGITSRTLANWKQQHLQIFQALKKGKMVAAYEIENELFETALAGDVTAMIFFLKNNYPEKYSDKPLSNDYSRAQIAKIKADTKLKLAQIEAISSNNSEFPEIKLVVGGDQEHGKDNTANA
ncbi:small terminase subunit [Lactiplantibacillus plantarum]|uniref:small terminase subunit n=1 Tax=Lactiplantibacillus plantarum TaxID=1590 RepID=UPI003096049D